MFNFIILTILIGAGNSIFHAERLRYGKVVLKTEELKKVEKSDNLHKVTDVQKVILAPLIIYFGYLVVKDNVWLLLLAIILNMPPINTITITLSNIIVIPSGILISKIRKVKI